MLGGGGPQAAFGARLWSDSVGFLSRSGSDLAEAQVEALHALDIDLPAGASSRISRRRGR